MNDAPENPRSGLAAVPEDELRCLVEEADLPTLLVTLSFLTGDRSLLDDAFRPTDLTPLTTDGTGGMTSEVRTTAVDKCVAALVQLGRTGPAETPPSEAELLNHMQFLTGPVGEDYTSLLLHELAIELPDAEPGWTKADVAPGRPFRVAVIGAGISGLAAARALHAAQVPYVVFERNADVGGVWLVNDYPGARLDTNNFTYAYSFDQQRWTEKYSTRDSILGYLRDVAAKYDITANVRFGTAVVEASFDDATCAWSLTSSGPGGRVTEEFSAVISAVGQLNEPNLPDLPGRESFGGDTWHTADWQHDVDLTGKRVGLIGTGASAFQVIPHLAERAATLTIFQRTAAWVMPSKDYMDPLPHGLQWLFEHVPHYHRWYRFMQFWVNVDGVRHYAAVDPQWKHPVSVSAANEFMRSCLECFLRESFAKRPELADKLLPTYPPYGKRTVRDNGTWAAAMQRDDVELVTEPISRVTQGGIETSNGVAHELDVIVYGTGFRASEFLSSMRVGRAAGACCWRSSGAVTRGPSTGSRSPTSRTSSASTGLTPT